MAKPISKGKTGANAVLFVIMAIGALGVFNLIAGRAFTRFDLTSEHVYTLSKGSKDLVRNLPDRLNVKLFMSEDLKPPFRQTAQFVHVVFDLGQQSPYLRQVFCLLRLPNAALNGVGQQEH